MPDMMTLWRLCRQQVTSTARQAFSGDGPAAEPKRWNDEGRRVVYCAASPALALVELIATISCEEEWPTLVLFRADVPTQVARERVAVEALPPDWRETPAPPCLRDIGNAWLERGRTALLMVPSAVVPHEANVLLAPEHPDFAHIALEGPFPFTPDSRLVAAFSRRK